MVDLGPPPDGDDGPAGGQGRLVTAQDGTGRGLEELLGDRVPDPEAARMVRRISRGLALHAGWRDADLVPGGGRAAPSPYRYRSDDIDLDRTLEHLVERPVPEETDVIVREPLRPSVDVVLMVDVSGSMRGEKVRVAAATVAALAGALGGPGGRHRLAVVGFWSDAAVLEPLGGGASPVVLLDRLLRVPARGLTNVQFGLATGDAVLRGSAARRRVGVLLTDAVHNAGPDPREVARRFGELHVLLEVDGEHDEPLGRDIARLGHGRTAVVRSHRDVGPALSRVLGRA
ncbi:vWA domain-containing protein [Patulibacter minatonensis]|uniref:vWA domain-containing protein n=1 Tax=Patulibacter minatonensis TaxID=298163 RepID=UPI001B7F7F70|nr:vWA domain-containing protein [Patulibacter minatonensis]